MKTIQIAPDLKLPLDTVVQRKAVIAKNRVGKSNLGCAYVEEVYNASVQSVVLDPKGDWYGIRSSADGKGPGLPFLVMGGDHGDVPLDPSAGSALGTYFGANHVDAVLDVSDFSKRDVARFGADFFESIYDARKKNRVPLNLVLEEAEDFAPQQIFDKDPNQYRCLGAVNKIAKKAGFLGIGLLLIAQRAASLNKNTLSQADAIFFMRTTAPQDIKAADAWLQDQDDEKRKEVLTHIQGLPTGSAYVWAPEHGIFQKVQIRRRTTFDAGFTPKVGESKPEPKVKAMVDLKALMGEMQAVVEKAKADDPKVMHARIKDLEKKLYSALNQNETRVVEKIVEKQVPYVPPEVRKVMATIQRELASIPPELLKGPIVAGIVARRTQELVKSSRPVTTNHVKPKPLVILKDDVDDRLNGPMQRILDAIAWFEAIGIEAPAKEAVAFKAGYRPGGGAFQNPLGALRNDKGNNPWPPLIQYGNGTVSLTADGRKRAAKPLDIGTAEDLHREVLAALDGPMAKILTVLLETYPDPISKETLAERAGYAEGGGAFQNPLGRLRSCGLIEYPQKGQVVALPLLFLEA